MHELQLSVDIVNAAAEAACDRGFPPEKIKSITLSIGPLSCASVPSLEFCMKLVLEQHGLQEAELRIDTKPAVAQCQCGHTYEARDMYGPCPACESFVRQFISGTDVVIESIEVEVEDEKTQN